MTANPKHYGRAPMQDISAPTKEEHDAHVEATGRPWTQPMWDLLGRRPKDAKRVDGDPL
jgi:hypothetical protein